MKQYVNATKESSIFTKEDAKMLENNLKRTGYDYDFEAFMMHLNYHASQDAATIEIPYSRFSQKAQEKFSELYREKVKVDVPAKATVEIHMNDEWGINAFIRDDSKNTWDSRVEIGFLDDPVLSDLHENACRKSHEETLDYVARYQRLKRNADEHALADLLHEFGDKYAISEGYRDEALSKYAADLDERKARHVS